jgi:hypothetical protein
MFPKGKLRLAHELGCPQVAIDAVLYGDTWHVTRNAAQDATGATRTPAEHADSPQPAERPTA